MSATASGKSEMTRNRAGLLDLCSLIGRIISSFSFESSRSPIRRNRSPCYGPARGSAKRHGLPNQVNLAAYLLLAAQGAIRTKERARRRFF